MSMSQKDFEIVAEVIASARKGKGTTTEQHQMINLITSELSLAFKLRNPRFNEAKFFKATGAEQ